MRALFMLLTLAGLVYNAFLDHAGFAILNATAFLTLWTSRNDD